MTQKLIYTGKGGYDADKEKANKYLTVGETYTLDHKIIHDWSTDVYLVEIQNTFHNGNRVYFNSVMFREEGEEESQAEYIERVKPSLEGMMEKLHEARFNPHKDLLEFLESIASNIGETTNNYHWRVACSLIEKYKTMR